VWKPADKSYSHGERETRIDEAVAALMRLVEPPMKGEQMRTLEDRMQAQALREINEQIPRRARLDVNTPAELAIRDAICAVEDAGCHQLLTEAVNLLQDAREKVADYVDRKVGK